MCSFVTNKLQILTKGDNNRVNDRGLYAPDQLWLTRQDIIGKVYYVFPFIGYVVILVEDYPTAYNRFVSIILVLYLLINRKFSLVDRMIISSVLLLYLFCWESLVDNTMLSKIGWNTSTGGGSAVWT